MSNGVQTEPTGLFSADYVSFLAGLAGLRPELQRYCARMTGSALDGEDVVQDAMFEAYRNLQQYDPGRPLRPWLFRIAHNRCIDLLRRRKVREVKEALADEPATVLPAPVAGREIGRAVEQLVIYLPPKERACVVLKDVLDHTLEEIADLVGSTPGGVKAALKRGRAKLASLNIRPSVPTPPQKERRELLELYIERFNRRDWDGVRALTSVDARLRVADCFSGRLKDSPYFAEYERPIIPWRMALGEVDGETAVLILASSAGRPYSAIRLRISDGRIADIHDYIKCPWLLEPARVTSYPVDVSCGPPDS